MLVLNKYQLTKDGDNVMPLVVLGETVQCADTKNNIIFKRLSDFDDTPNKKEEKENVIEVSPIEEMNNDILVDEEVFNSTLYENELFEEEEKEEEKEEKKEEVKKQEKPKNWYISDEQYI